MDMDALKQLFDMHIKECDARDARNSKSFTEMTSMVKGIWNTMDENKKSDSAEKKEMKAEITQIQIRIAYGLGALFIALKCIDWLLPYIHNK